MSARPESIFALRRPAFLRVPRYLLAALPICLAYIPIAFAFGVSARNLGFPFAATAAMSLFVYAGASQMIAIGLMASGQPLSVILLTTFLVNLRMFLLSTAISERLGSWNCFHKILFGLQHTDETFAALSADGSGGEPLVQHRTLNFQSVIHLCWILGTILGYQLSDMVLDVKVLGLDYALSGMLIGLAGLMVRTRIQLVVGAFSASIALIAIVCGQGTWGVLIAAVCGPSLGYWMERACQEQVLS